MRSRIFPRSETVRNGWIKSSHSNAGGSCVEVKFDGGAILVRDSKDKRVGQPVLAVATPAWRSFLATVTHREG
ncbi:MAG TPA: DUF397 domain-containing protein [Pseudonocardiaceae bacterium]|nr:DUF397 domain-containing protein [Pseudonocardiaceae bacterium]